VPADGPINPPVICNVMWAITDFTVENGATRLVPGSRLSGVEPDPEATFDTVQAIAPAGCIVLWEGRTWHAASLNTRRTSRIGITTYWAAPFIRHLLNFTYGTRSEVIAGLSDHERALMGFGPWSTYGSIGDFNAKRASPGDENTGELK